MRIVLATALAALIATPVDLVIEETARRTFAVSPDFGPFQGTVGPYTVGGVALAGIVFWIVRRFAREPRRVYLVIAAVALVLSWVPDIALLVLNDPGATVPAVASLMVMHAVAAVTVVGLLLWLSGPRAPRAATG